MLRASAALVLLLALCAASGACTPAHIGRTGPAHPSRLGPPQNRCETEGWYELAPARVRAEGATGIGTVMVVETRDAEGVGVFRAGQRQPEELRDVWPALGERALAESHEARLAPTEAKKRRAIRFLVGSILALGGGLGGAAALQDHSGGGAAALGLTGLIVGLGTALAAQVVSPSSEEQLDYETRRKLLVPGEDDLAAAVRGVERADAARRALCANPGH